MPIDSPNPASPGAQAPRWLHWLALAAVIATLALIALGGVVTSKGVGMAVPDWPTTFDHNMYTFPVAKWQGGIFWEHTHRLVASSIGALTIILAICIQRFDERRWLRQLAWTAVPVVCLQGLLGGLRVELNRIPVFGMPGAIFFGVLHATISQIFLCVLGVIALGTSAIWTRVGVLGRGLLGGRAHREVLALTGAMIVQLVIAATMRHQHAGLAIPDFPLAYGRIYPATDADTLSRINQRRGAVVDDAPVQAFHVHLQMAHRIVALLLVSGVVSFALRQRGSGQPWAAWSRIWAILLVVQCGLGAATIWTGKNDGVATAHVAVGALSLLTGATLGIALLRARNGAMAINPCDPTRGEIQTAAEVRSLAS